MRAFFLIASIGVISAPLLIFGTDSPCGIVRAEVRQAAKRQGGIEGVLATAIPDKIIDAFLETQVGPLSPVKCIALAFQGIPAEPGPGRVQPVVERPAVSTPIPLTSYQAVHNMNHAAAEADAAIAECRNKRHVGEFSTHLESAECAKPQIISAYQKVNFRYMDIIVRLADERLELARAVDEGSLSESRALTELNSFMHDIEAETRERDARQQ